MTVRQRKYQGYKREHLLHLAAMIYSENWTNFLWTVPQIQGSQLEVSTLFKQTLQNNTGQSKKIPKSGTVWTEGE